MFINFFRACFKRICHHTGFATKVKMFTDLLSFITSVIQLMASCGLLERKVCPRIVHRVVVKIPLLATMPLMISLLSLAALCSPVHLCQLSALVVCNVHRCGIQAIRFPTGGQLHWKPHTLYLHRKPLHWTPSCCTENLTLHRKPSNAQKTFALHRKTLHQKTQTALLPHYFEIYVIYIYWFNK